MKTYLVGGAVRDELLGRKVLERDHVVVGASEREMLRHGFVRVGHAFPVFLHPDTGEEHALARTESKVAPGHTGFEFDASKNVDLVTDLKRRDLTINAMAKDEDGKIIDPYGGRDDLERPWFVECQFSSSQYAKLGMWQRDLPSGVARFATLATLLGENACQALAKRLVPPKRYGRAAALAARYANIVRHWRADDAESICDALVAFASLKPAAARDEVIQVMARVAEIDQATLNARSQAIGALRLDAQSKPPEGREYGLQLRSARVALVKTWLN